MLVIDSPNELLSDEELECLRDMVYSIRLAARITDMPCADMDVDQFVQEIKDVAAKLDITPVIIRGEELREKGFGG